MKRNKERRKISIVIRIEDNLLKSLNSPTKLQVAYIHKGLDHDPKQQDDCNHKKAINEKINLQSKKLNPVQKSKCKNQLNFAIEMEAIQYQIHAIVERKFIFHTVNAHQLNLLDILLYTNC
jgi:hypothetical protein